MQILSINMDILGLPQYQWNGLTQRLHIWLYRQMMRGFHAVKMGSRDLDL